MSTATYNALADAIQAHVSDNNEAGDYLLTDWVVYSYSSSMTRASCGGYQRSGSNMPPHTLMGLIDRLQRTAGEDDNEDTDE